MTVLAEVRAAPMGPHAHNLGLPQKIFVVRHGQSSWNKTKRVTGQLNPPLADEGWAQARRLAEVLHAEALDAVYSSTLNRAVDTARATAGDHGLGVIQCDDLREQHLGVLQGQIRDARNPVALTLWRLRKADMLNFRVPGGETYTELEQRLRHFVQARLTRHRGGTVLIVGHRNSNRALLSVLLDMPLREAAAVPLRSKFLYEITPGSEPKVRTVSLRPRNLGEVWQGFRT